MLTEQEAITLIRDESIDTNIVYLIAEMIYEGNYKRVGKILSRDSYFRSRALSVMKAADDFDLTIFTAGKCQDEVGALAAAETLRAMIRVICKRAMREAEAHDILQSKEWQPPAGWGAF